MTLRNDLHRWAEHELGYGQSIWEATMLSLARGVTPEEYQEWDLGELWRPDDATRKALARGDRKCTPEAYDRLPAAELEAHRLGVMMAESEDYLIPVPTTYWPRKD